MRIDKLKQIIEVADTQSITAAAERLFITQPSLSQSILIIEKEMGIKIFDRSKKGTFLTQAGEQIINSARKIVKEEEEMKNIALRTNAQPVGAISIATIPSFGMSFLPTTISKFKSEFPGIKIKVLEGGSYFVKEQIMTDKADIGLLSYTEGLFPEEKKIIFKHLITSSIKVLVNRESDLAKQKALHPKELIKNDIVIFNPQYNINSYVYELLEPYGEPKFFFTTNNPEVMKKVILDGLAIGFYAGLALVTDIYVRNKDIIPVDIDNQRNTQRNFGLVYKSNTGSISYIQEFINELYFQCNIFKKIYNYKDS